MPKHFCMVRPQNNYCYNDGDGDGDDDDHDDHDDDDV